MGLTPITFKPVVLQPELQNIIALRAEIAYRSQTLLGCEESVLMRLVRGADIEPGVHQAWLRDTLNGRIRKQILEVR
jgi:hypothetical protein